MAFAEPLAVRRAMLRPKFAGPIPTGMSSTERDPKPCVDIELNEATPRPLAAAAELPVAGLDVVPLPCIDLAAVPAADGRRAASEVERATIRARVVMARTASRAAEAERGASTWEAADEVGDRRGERATDCPGERSARAASARAGAPAERRTTVEDVLPGLPDAASWNERCIAAGDQTAPTPRPPSRPARPAVLDTAPRGDP